MEKIGSIFVDAGIVMVGDPCYTLPDSSSLRDEVARDWDQFCKALGNMENGVVAPFATKETGLVVESGWGDGEYPVYVEREGGRVARLIVEFISDEEEEDEDY